MLDLFGHDDGDSQNNPDIRRGDRPVMLSAAKHLAAQWGDPSLRSG